MSFAALPAGQFDLIYADPPWCPEWDGARTSPRLRANQYPLVSTEELCKLPVREVCSPAAVLYLWAIPIMMTAAVAVLEWWGFRYVSQMVWVKTGRGCGLGWWARGDHELLLIGRKPNSRCPAPSLRRSSVITAARREHSRKPDEVRALLELQYPEAHKLELFARETSPGWTSWGNEV